jgi:hypothetical protein
MEAIIYFAGLLAIFRAGIQERNLKKLIKENKELKQKLGR